MRINKFVAKASGLSRRAADAAIAQGRVAIHGEPATIGQEVAPHQHVTLDGMPLHLPSDIQTVLLNKPAGYVVSRNGQGSKTIYELLPAELHHLKPVGRLDKDSSGLLLLTNDGALANMLTHPRFAKTKIYEVTLDKPLTPPDWRRITREGVELEDGLSRFMLDPMNDENYAWKVTMQEGRNRQIRRTFATLGYTVVHLNRTQFGEFLLSTQLRPGHYTTLAS